MSSTKIEKIHRTSRFRLDRDHVPCNDPLFAGLGIACNGITGANAIEFTRESENAGNEDTSGAGGSGGGAGVGGNGDGNKYELSCGEGNVAIGIYGRSGAWLDALGLVCASYQSDGTLYEVQWCVIPKGNSLELSGMNI